MQKFKYKPPVNTGDLRNRVTFYNPPAQITNGWPSTEWTPHVDVWAKIQTRYGSKMFNSDATQWQDKKILTIRYRDDLIREMRVEVKGKMHEIESLTNDDEMNKYLTLVIKEVM